MVIHHRAAHSAPLSVASRVERVGLSIFGVMAGDGDAHYPSGGLGGPVKSVSGGEASTAHLPVVVRSVGIFGGSGGIGERHPRVPLLLSGVSITPYASAAIGPRSTVLGMGEVVDERFVTPAECMA